jgi:rhodanese-related sulfurtransferase
MKNIISILILLVVLIGCDRTDAQTTIEPQVFAAKVKDVEKVLLIDVRTPPEFAASHLANAVNIDWNSPDFDSKAATLDKSKTLLLYCKKGVRSAAAAKALRIQGFTVFDLSGGIDGWRSAGLPVVK